MATWDDVRRLALSFPEATEGTSWGTAAWKVRDKLFVWERPLRQGDLAALGDAAPTGAILGAKVQDEGARQALIADEPAVFFTIPHFNGYPAVLVRLDPIGTELLTEVVTEAWLAAAPKRLSKAYLAERGE